jgi:hypothetical protein
MRIKPHLEYRVVQRRDHYAGAELRAKTHLACRKRPKRAHGRIVLQAAE